MPHGIALRHPHPVLVLMLLAALAVVMVMLLRMGAPVHHVVGMAKTFYYE